MVQLTEGVSAQASSPECINLVIYCHFPPQGGTGSTKRDRLVYCVYVIASVHKMEQTFTPLGGEGMFLVVRTWNGGRGQDAANYPAVHSKTVPGLASP